MIWRMAIAIDYATYEEMCARHIVAGGWSALGDLSCLYQACRAGYLNWEQTLEILRVLAPDDADQVRFQNTFRRLLIEIQPGDIIIGYQGINPVGICQIAQCSTYVFDNAGAHGIGPEAFGEDYFEYAHCLYGVNWVSWEAFNDFIVGNGGESINPGHIIIPGIIPCRIEVENILHHWGAYKALHPDILPCSPEILQNCNNMQAAMANAAASCYETIKYWRSKKMHDEIENTLNFVKQIILCGPPGTGKTYLAKQFVEQHWQLPNEQYEIIQLHPAYNYEDFVRGIQVSTKDGKVQYDTVHRVFSRLCNRALHDNNPDNKYVLIIDEINRAHLAAVMGELIYGLEYRDNAVRTPYEVDGSFDLRVPKNLYIIGTMNTADRSIGHIDYAVRRRFAFVPMLPDPEVIEQNVAVQGDLQTSAFQLYDAVASLFSKENAQLTSDFFADDVQPGHTYFLAESCDELLTKFVYQVLPLLHEYVKDGVLNVNAKLTIADLAIELNQPIRPMQIAEQLRGTLPCFQKQPQADVANGAE